MASIYINDPPYEEFAIPLATPFMIEIKNTFGVS
jgi:hypothetical protein